MGYLTLRFIGFIFTVFMLYYLIGKFFPKRQWIVLLLGSMFFYASFDIRYFLFLFFSIISTFLAAKNIEDTKTNKNRKAMLISIIMVNLILLIFVKYANWGLSILGLVTSRLGFSLHSETFNIIVPIGIAYYTMQIISYLVDVYRGNTKAEKNIFKYTLFISYFPHIIQGPIPRKEQLYETLFVTHKFNYEKMCKSFQLIGWGILKKMVIADRLGVFVGYVFGSIAGFKGITLYVAMIFYTIQIYMDFSGCVDICRGVSRLFQVELPINFNNPYLATSIKDFWGKWHISFSAWLKEYVYIPLGGNRKGALRKYINLFITFLISGLWHGVGLKFIIWGELHAGYQVMGELSSSFRKKTKEVMRINRFSEIEKTIKVIFTFHLVAFAWIFFRAESLTQACLFIKNMFSEFNIWVLFDKSLYAIGITKNGMLLCIIVTICIFIIENINVKKYRILDRISSYPVVIRWFIYVSFAIFIITFACYGPVYNASDFIYGAF